MKAITKRSCTPRERKNSSIDSASRGLAGDTPFSPQTELGRTPEDEEFVAKGTPISETEFGTPSDQALVGGTPIFPSKEMGTDIEGGMPNDEGFADVADNEMAGWDPALVSDSTLDPKGAADEVGCLLVSSCCSCFMFLD